MKTTIVALFFLHAVLAGECNSYQREQLNEGYKPCVYYDSKGIPTVGVGFNLQKSSARSQLQGVGADYDQVLSGAECLTDDQINELFDEDMQTAMDCGSDWLTNWNNLDDGPQSAIADMIFNLGCGGIQAFVRLHSAVLNSDWNGAASQMQNSLWCSQVGSRCTRDQNCMLEGK